MAHPLKIGASGSFGPGTMRKRPELAMLIGCACSDWSYVEESICMFYGHLMGVYLPQSQGSGPPSHPVARQIFEEVQTIHLRLNLVSKLADWVIKDEIQKNDVLSVLKKLRRAGNGRNTLAHGVWGICDSEPDALILIPTFGHQLIYKKNDFEIVLEKIKKAKEELGRVHHEFYQNRQSKKS